MARSGRPLDELHRHVHPALLARLQDPHDVGVVEPLPDLLLAPEPLGEDDVALVLEMRDLERHGGAGVGVARLEDRRPCRCAPAARSSSYWSSGRRRRVRASWSRRSGSRPQPSVARWQRASSAWPDGASRLRAETPGREGGSMSPSRGAPGGGRGAHRRRHRARRTTRTPAALLQEARRYGGGGGRRRVELPRRRGGQPDGGGGHAARLPGGAVRTGPPASGSTAPSSRPTSRCTTGPSPSPSCAAWRPR